MDTPTCPICGTQNTTDAHFCKECGAELNEPLTEMDTWVIAARNGNNRAMEFICERIADSLFMAARSIVKNDPDAEDIVQETMISIIKNIHSLEDVRKFNAWAKRIVIHLSLNLLKKERTVSLREEDGEDMLEQIADERELYCPQEMLEQKEAQKILENLIDQLPAVQQQTVLLFYAENLPISEIAQLMECSENTVKSRLSYARAKLCKSITDIEKKEGIRLHSLVGVPLLPLLFQHLTPVVHPDIHTYLVSAIARLMQGLASTVPEASAAGPAAHPGITNTPISSPGATAPSSPHMLHSARHFFAKGMLGKSAAAIAAVIVATTAGSAAYYTYAVPSPDRVVANAFDSVDDLDIHRFVSCLDPNTEQKAKLGIAIVHNLTGSDVNDILRIIPALSDTAGITNSSSDHPHFDVRAKTIAVSGKVLPKFAAANRAVENALGEEATVEFTINQGGGISAARETFDIVLRKYGMDGWRIPSDTKISAVGKK